MKYLTLDELLQAHETLIKKFGGSAGIRDEGLLQSAVQRPKTTVFNREAYPSLFDKAAAICHSLLFNHPFVDGNKRSAFAACHLTLLMNGYNLTSKSQDTYDFLIQVIRGHGDWSEISTWLKKHSKKYKTPSEGF